MSVNRIEKFILGVKLSNIKIVNYNLNNIPGTIDHRDLVRANANPWIKDRILKSINLITNDKYLSWAIELLKNESRFVTLYKIEVINKPSVVRYLGFMILFYLQLLSNLVSLLRQNFKKPRPDKTSKSKFQFQNLWLDFRFFWLVTLQQFFQVADCRLTAVNLVFTTNKEILLAKRRYQWVTGDMDWGWFQGGINTSDWPCFGEIQNYFKIHNSFFLEKKSTPTPSLFSRIFNKFQARSNILQSLLFQLNEFQTAIIRGGCRELQEETNLKPFNLWVCSPPIFSEIENLAISLRRFLILGCRYSKSEKYLVFLLYPFNKPRVVVNWENQDSGWFNFSEAKKILVPEKLKDLILAEKIINSINLKLYNIR